MPKTYHIFLIIFLFLGIPLGVDAGASMSIVPSSGTYDAGKTISVQIVVSSDTPLNAISGSVLFPASLFSIQSVSKNGSILNFWVSEPSFGPTGTVRFEGVAINGFQGPSGKVLTITLRGKPGSGVVSFQSGQVLANDGQGTDITGKLANAEFSIREAVQILEKDKIEKPETEKQVETVEKPEMATILKPPIISKGAKYGKLSIMGISNYRDAQVLVTFVTEDGAKIFITGASEADGSFNIVVPNSLKRGSYSVTAVMIRDDNTKSDPSNTTIIKIGNIFSDLSKEVITTIILLMFAVLCLLIRISHHFGKNKNLYLAVKHRTNDAEKIIHKSFDILRKDVQGYENENLTATKRRKMASIEEDLDAAEKIIDEKVDDIKSV